MSIFFPYDPSVVIDYISDLFSIDLSSLTSADTLIITILCNLYFFIIWFFVIYFTLKIFNRIWERLF